MMSVISKTPPTDEPMIIMSFFLSIGFFTEFDCSYSPPPAVTVSTLSFEFKKVELEEVEVLPLPVLVFVVVPVFLLVDVPVLVLVVVPVLELVSEDDSVTDVVVDVGSVGGGMMGFPNMSFLTVEQSSHSKSDF